MLVLTRKTGERIHLGDDIWIQVLDINNGAVRLGIEAPKEVEVHRHEVYKRIRKVKALSEPLSQTAPLECRA